MARILCVDPDNNFSNMLKVLLKREGISAITAKSFEHAMDIIDQVDDITLVTVAEFVEGASYKDVCSIVQDSKRYKSTPVFLLCSNSTAEIEREARKYGASEVLLKKDLNNTADYLATVSRKQVKALSENIYPIKGSESSTRFDASELCQTGVKT